MLLDFPRSSRSRAFPTIRIEDDGVAFGASSLDARVAPEVNGSVSAITLEQISKR